MTSRYGRTIKKPDRYEPQEICEDDYDSEDMSDSDTEITIKKPISKKKKPLDKRTINLDEESDGETLGSESDSESVDSDSDADDEGNLKGFVCYSEEEEEEEEEEDE